MPPPTQPGELRSALLAQLDPAVRAAIGDVIRSAEGGVYAVGGAVRDALLGRPVTDVDLATEDDAIVLARAALPDGRITTHARFRTATLKHGATRLDIATTRTEAYAAPGALPRVAMPATIEQDLRRRDFSINAMALRLDGEAALRDPCGGLRDLGSKSVRVLHDASFRDDPTRIYRAFRYAARLGFAVEPATRALVDPGLQHVAAVGGERLRRELELLLLDAPPGAALEACAAAGALRAINPAIAWDPQRSRAVAERAAGSLQQALAFGFALLTAGADAAAAERVSQRLRLRRAETAAVRAGAALRASAHVMARPGARPSGVVALLDRYPLPAVTAFAAMHRGQIAGDLALRYLGEWRRVKPSLTGADLQDLGVPAGPQVQHGLQLLRAAKLDGTAPDAPSERELALRFARSIRDSVAGTAGIDVRTNGR